MEKYITWDAQTPGISFSERRGRIIVFKKTLEKLGFPAYFRFLFDPEHKSFVVECCEMDNEGAHKLSKSSKNEYCEIKSLSLVRLVARSCGWNEKISYRVPGVVVPEFNLVQFDLTKALEIHEGRLTEPDMLSFSDDYAFLED